VGTLIVTKATHGERLVMCGQKKKLIISLAVDRADCLKSPDLPAVWTALEKLDVWCRV